ncbi:trace amine-associated receptor 13c-like [Hoplias malabaricus]|uniref:trace amine-associated receptor 13c-like n=1 Tax=Hoplias malabaricus TaxID=27720 RepID=UPI00346317E7
METIDYKQNISTQYCFPGNNQSCKKEVRGSPAYIFLFIVLSCISVCTVFLNLLVIISISHFKQLHTPTNLLILSLAVADFLVGLFVMPMKIMQVYDSCWYLGKLACSLTEIIIGILVLASLCNLVFIAVDRYIAISDPLLYSTRVTPLKMSVSIIMGWSFCLVYVLVFMYCNDHLYPDQMYNTCYGECIVFVKFSWTIANMIVFFLTPCSSILILYSLIFNMARHQAKAVRAAMNSHGQGTKVSNSSETKAAKTLGVVIFFYLSFWIPFYISSLTVTSLTTLSVLWTVFTWLMFINSFVNPLIYAIFYPWFRVSAKYIVTCRIFESSSSNMNLYRSH